MEDGFCLTAAAFGDMPDGARFVEDTSRCPAKVAGDSDIFGARLDRVQRAFCEQTLGASMAV